MLEEVGSEEGALGRNILMSQGEELTWGHGVLGGHEDTECLEPPSAVGTIRLSLEEQQTQGVGGKFSSAVAQGRRRFPDCLSQSVLQRWRWFKCASGDGAGALVLPCPQPPSESATEEEELLLGSFPWGSGVPGQEG